MSQYRYCKFAETTNQTESEYIRFRSIVNGPRKHRQAKNK